MPRLLALAFPATASTSTVVVSPPKGTVVVLASPGATATSTSTMTSSSSKITSAGTTTASTVPEFTTASLAFVLFAVFAAGARIVQRLGNESMPACG